MEPIAISTTEKRTTTIAVRRAELLDLKRLQLAAEEAGGRKPTLSDVIRQALDALARVNGGR